MAFNEFKCKPYGDTSAARDPFALGTQAAFFAIISRSCEFHSQKAVTPSGVPAEYGAQSSGGAAVNLWVSLGWKPEMIAEIGQWASLEAF